MGNKCPCCIHKLEDNNNLMVQGNQEMYTTGVATSIVRIPEPFLIGNKRDGENPQHQMIKIRGFVKDKKGVLSEVLEEEEFKILDPIKYAITKVDHKINK